MVGCKSDDFLPTCVLGDVVRRHCAIGRPCRQSGLRVDHGQGMAGAASWETLADA